MKSFGKKPFNKNKQTTANYNKFDIMNRRRQKTPKYKISNQKNSTQKNGYENSLLEKVKHNIQKTPNKTFLRKTQKKKKKKKNSH